MSSLIKGMYADYQNETFGIRYNQIRTDALLTNAGWFNSKGEKLGFGDLNFADLDNISLDIEENETFIALSEADTSWDMPSHLDRNNPGIDYVMTHAKWVVSGLPETEGYIYCIKPDHTFGSSDVNTIYKDQIEQYYTCKRHYLFQALQFDGTKFVGIKPTPTAVSCQPGSYFGLDQYELTDGSVWVVGKKDQFDAACMQRARELLWKQPNSTFINNTSIPDLELDVVLLIIKEFASRANSSIIKLLSENDIKNISTKIVKENGVIILSDMDSLLKYSVDIKGLPPGVYALRIE